MSVQKWIEDISSQFEENSAGLKLFRSEMKSFETLYNRAKKQKETGSTTVDDWENIKPISPQLLIQYSELPKEVNEVDPSKIIILKLCGGLGTTMGLKKPKGLVVVRNGKSFLDFAIEQTLWTMEKYKVNIPLVLMTSFFTHEAIVKYISTHPLRKKVNIFTFQQKKFPRISSESFLPISTSYNDPSQWSPPGHGDVYDSFLNSEIYKELNKQEKTHLFISNIDNLGAIFDASIFSYVIRTKTEFCLEVTRKTLNDVKGGTVVQVNGGNPRLLEVAQVPRSHLNEFFSIDKFRIFNTNSMWISLRALEENISEILSPIIFNRKILNGKEIVQLETACGSALESFKNSVIQVPRIRRVTVKNCQDLFLAQSGLYDLINSGTRFTRRKNPNNDDVVTPLPIIRFIGEEWKSLNLYNERIGEYGIPDISKLDSLEIKGEVFFQSGENIQLEGDVKYDGSVGKIVL